MVARLIHEQGPRPERPFVAVDCSAATASLFEPESAFRARVPSTLAAGSKSRERLFDSAGTIFLSEIWTLAPELQSKLVRLLQEREIRPLGDNKAVNEARIIAASSCDLEVAVQQVTFRRDLYVRLNLSCAVPRQGRPRMAIPLVRGALDNVDRVPWTWHTIHDEPDHASLHGDPEFEALAEEVKRTIEEGAAGEGVAKDEK